MSEAKPQAVFSPEQAHILADVLDEIVPESSDGRLPGAGALGLVEHLEAVAAKNPDLLPAITDGLARLDAQVRGRGSQSFAELAREVRLEILNELGSSAPAFVPSLVFQTYVAYYQHPRVQEALGLEARPPHPKGYEMEPGDLSLLDPVRARPKLYRDV